MSMVQERVWNHIPPWPSGSSWNAWNTVVYLFITRDKRQIWSTSLQGFKRESLARTQLGSMTSLSGKRNSSSKENQPGHHQKGDICPYLESRYWKQSDEGILCFFNSSSRCAMYVRQAIRQAFLVSVSRNDPPMSQYVKNSSISWMKSHFSMALHFVCM